MKAIGYRVLVDPTPPETVTKAGIILQPKVEEKPTSGKVVSVGGEVKEVKVGDTAHFNKHVAIEVMDGEKKYVVLREEEIYTVD